ncbi:MAG: hypothetical protein UT08_C0007G0040 [Candidatus Woesebacteria bacterium GW2011_GWB1_38_8]|uniref:Dockerin domain-containing protein n=1 Tax=Candidatus Woesebacteria bacterium GW2011_GWB1_38_8 TaxID=1618570 RepID=A0A0G0L2Y0_9BACT|nr:MAG: hypothetical protein UT08_C0007G0040 [Candidatus Woesebacteria bacterium GW2011_GWB1_38_8]
MSKKVDTNSNFRFIASLAATFFLSLTLINSVYLVRWAKNIRRGRAQVINGLWLGISKGRLSSPDSYIIYVLDAKWPYQQYTGNLDLRKKICDANGANCTTTEGLWLDSQGNPVFISNGLATINIPSGIPNTINEYWVKPNPNPRSLDWSTEALFSIGTTNGLYDVSQYFIKPSEETTYSGENNTSGQNVSFQTKIGYEATAADCDGSLGQIMYLMKSRPEGYPNPKTPWKDIMMPSGYDRLVPKYHILNWQKKTGWHDEYATIYGVENYQMNLNSPLNKNDNFNTKISQTRYGSRDSMFPPHYLAPKWIGWSWDVQNSRASEASRSAQLAFCNIPANENPDYYWEADSDLIYLGDYGEVIRLKYYEGENNFLSDDSKAGKREDWYFAKDVGLVKLEVVYFCPLSWGNFPNCLPCNQNSDCAINEFMKAPHITLNRVQGPPLPTPTPGWIQLDLTARPSTGTAPLKIDLTANVSGTIGPPYVYRFDCTNDGTWEYQEFKTTNSLTVFQLCTYTTPDKYTLHGRVEAGGTEANDAISIDVLAVPTATPTPSFTPTPTGPCAKPGDANADCKVDFIDYAIWRLHFGQTTTNGIRDGDFNNSNFVDFVDYAIWRLNFGT